MVAALGVSSGISKSEVSRICVEFDVVVDAFRDRALDHTRFPYIYLYATCLNVRDDHQIVSKAVVVATGITAGGQREVLGLDVGDSEDEAFWRAFLRSLKNRGLGGVRLLISDQHAGLTAAIRRCFQGTAHQRCRVHFARNLLARIPRAHQDMVAALFRTVFAGMDETTVNTQLWWGRIDVALHLLALERDCTDDAFRYSIRAVVLFEEFPHRLSGSAPALLGWLSTKHGVTALRDAWSATTGTQIPADVFNWITEEQGGSR